jgi:cytidylate kinase
MENRLFEYMNRRISNENLPAGLNKEPGPVITISRQTGCGASRIAWGVCAEINMKLLQKNKSSKWNFINREILQKSAEQLHLDPMALQHVLNDEDRGIMDQIIDALSTHSHKSDQKIMKTIQEVIRQFGNNGNVIIVGRGGASICKGIERSLHIRIEAPEEWRIAEITNRFNYSTSFATEYVRKHDHERELQVAKLFGSKTETSKYDIEINRSRFSIKEIIDLITDMASIKQLF